MSRRIHISQSIRGALTNWGPKDWQGATDWITRNDGSRMSANEVKQSFLDLIAEGKECLPFGDCDNFDFKTGCKGHPILDPAESSACAVIAGQTKEPSK